MDFNDFMACCSANYQRIHTLLKRHPTFTDILTCPIGTTGEFRLKFIKKKPYTDLISIQFETLKSSPWLPKLDIEVKLYHDAQLVEVSGCIDPFGKMQNFAHASSHKHFPYWEKWQLNKHLAEILTLVMMPK